MKKKIQQNDAILPVIPLTYHLDRIDFSKAFGTRERFSAKKNNVSNAVLILN